MKVKVKKESESESDPAHLPAVLPTLVGGEEEDVSAKLEVVSTTSSSLGTSQTHLLDEDGEPVQGGRQEQLQVAAEH